MENEFFGVILNTANATMANTSRVELLGKTMANWVALSFGGAEYISVDYFDESVEVPLAVKSLLKPQYAYTVVLYSDTPLITKRTVLDALKTLVESEQNVIKLTRGYVFKTSFLMSAERILAANTIYFDEEDFVTAYNYRQVSLITEILKQRILAFHMENGVHFLDSATTYIGCDVVIGKNVVISPNNNLGGKTVIKDNVKLLPNNVIEDSIIDDGAKINSSQIYRSYVGVNTTVGPFAYIRPDTVIGENCRIGDFVEIKKSIIESGSKVSHLTYIGDCEMGSDCNVACGVVVANYDGMNKHKTKVGDNVFIGSNVNLIAPLTVGDGAFLAAGSTITEDVPPKALAVARGRQYTKQGWTKNKYLAKLEMDKTKEDNSN